MSVGSSLFAGTQVFLEGYELPAEHQFVKTFPVNRRFGSLSIVNVQFHRTDDIVQVPSHVFFHSHKPMFKSRPVLALLVKECVDQVDDHM